MRDQTASGGLLGPRDAVEQVVSTLIGPTPVIQVTMGGVEVPCLVDTGSNVTIITESFFREHFESKGESALKECGWLTLRAVNGMSMPYLGYLQLDVEIMGKVLPQCGVLVVHDPTDSVTKLEKSRIPGLVGMNIIKDCNDILSCHPELRTAKRPDGFKDGFAKVLSASNVLVPAGSMCFIPATGPEAAMHQQRVPSRKC